jgi:hypothetical protein
MVNEELVNWIKSEEAQGYSEKALTKILTKQNYSNKDIQEAFNSLKKENNKTPFSISFALLSGFGFLFLILTAIILSIATFSAGMILGYILLILAGTGISYYIYYIKNKLNATERLGAIFGIFSPALSLILIIATLKILQTLSKQLASFSAEGQQVGGMAGMLNIFSPAMNPIIAGILFYLSCNIFPIISIIKNKKNQTFLWYLLAPTLFFVLWLIIDLFTSSIMSSTLM